MSHREHDDRSTRDADATIDRIWREASAESPPLHLDARILAAAREAAVRQDTDPHRARAIEPRSPARWTWRPLLAAAAAAGIAFAIVPPLLRQAEGPVPPRAERGTNVPAAAQVSSSAAPVPAPPAATAEAPNAGEPAAVTGGSGAFSHADRALPSAPATLSKSTALLTPTDRAAKIAALYESGDVTAAAEELRAFRATRPDADAYLPATLQDWARTVK